MVWRGAYLSCSRKARNSAGASTRIPYPSLAEVWPLIRAILRRQLRHGYKIVEPQKEPGGSLPKTLARLAERTRFDEGVTSLPILGDPHAETFKVEATDFDI